MTSPSIAKDRFHDLDAVRAFAMTLGIVFHAAWLFIPEFFFTPYPDVASTNWLFYFFCASHVFRMQLFFLVAGFFGNMLQQKRGTFSLIRNRLQRIGLPFLIFGLLLTPISYFQFTLGGIASGRILTDRSVWDETLAAVASANVSDVMVLHLWFLYYLLMLYVLMLLVRALLIASTSIRRKIGLTQQTFARLASTHLFMPVLVGTSASLMMLSSGWFGIDSPILGLEPNLRILVEFFLFFACGWLLLDAQELIGVVTRNYRRQLLIGVALTVPIFLWMKYADEHGYSTWAYPMLVATDVADEELMRTHLLNQENVEATEIYQAIPTVTQDFIRDSVPLTSHQKAGLAETLNVHVVAAPQLFGAENSERQSPSDPMKMMMLNRLALESALPNSIYSDARNKPYYWPFRAIYAIVYSTSMWLLVFGTIGFFRQHFSKPHPIVRYWSDASYWMYLVHLNVLFAIQYGMGDWHWHWLPKICVYLLICFAVLLPSYHFLVRGTYVGVLLNGRRYPTTIGGSRGPNAKRKPQTLT